MSGLLEKFVSKQNNVPEIVRIIEDYEAGARDKAVLARMGVPWALLHPTDFPPGSIERYRGAMHRILRLEAARDNIIAEQASELIRRWDKAQGFS